MRRLFSASDEIGAHFRRHVENVTKAGALNHKQKHLFHFNRSKDTRNESESFSHEVNVRNINSKEHRRSGLKYHFC